MGSALPTSRGWRRSAESPSRGLMDTQKAAQQLVQTSAERRDLIVQFKIDAGSVGRRLTRRAEAQMRTRKPPAGPQIAA